jgi:hypothetical protein
MTYGSAAFRGAVHILAVCAVALSGTACAVYAREAADTDLSLHARTFPPAATIETPSHTFPAAERIQQKLDVHRLDGRSFRSLLTVPCTTGRNPAEKERKSDRGFASFRPCAALVAADVRLTGDGRTPVTFSLLTDGTGTRTLEEAVRKRT